MPGEALAAAAVAKLLDDVFLWFTDPSKYAAMTREEKLGKLHDALKVALDAKAYSAADIIFASMRRLAAETGP